MEPVGHWLSTVLGNVDYLDGFKRNLVDFERQEQLLVGEDSDDGG